MNGNNNLVVLYTMNSMKEFLSQLAFNRPSGHGFKIIRFQNFVYSGFGKKNWKHKNNSFSVFGSPFLAHALSTLTFSRLQHLHCRKTFFFISSGFPTRLNSVDASSLLFPRPAATLYLINYEMHITNFSIFFFF